MEQSPLLPAVRKPVEEQQIYFKRCLESNTVGSVSKLSEEEKQMYREWAGDQQTLLSQAVHELSDEKRHRRAAEQPTDEKKIEAWQGTSLPPIQIYRVKYDLGLSGEVREEDYTRSVWRKIQQRAKEIKKRHLAAVATGEVDNRAPLEPARRAWFEKEVREYNPSDYPEQIPEVFAEASCNIFGHICPVFFTAEGLTETEEERRIGRHQLKFETMMRIVRRDDYRCQHCKKKLRDDEVEFDHIIPVSKGGNSEEHNLRLTCFDCNRDKSDSFQP